MTKRSQPTNGSPVTPATGSPATATGPVAVLPEPPPAQGRADAAGEVTGAATDAPNVAAEQPDGAHVTAPVSGRPAVRAGAARTPRDPRRFSRRGPLTRMGPWAPVAGALAGLLLGALAVVLLAGAAVGFADRLALALLVVALGLLGAAATLIGDEVAMIRNCVREAVLQPDRIRLAVPLLTGLTPARLLLLGSGFVFFLAAFVAR